jgi:hypothetical protein
MSEGEETEATKVAEGAEEGAEAAVEAVGDAAGAPTVDETEPVAVGAPVVADADKKKEQKEQKKQAKKAKKAKAKELQASDVEQAAARIKSSGAIELADSNHDLANSVRELAGALREGAAALTQYVRQNRSVARRYAPEEGGNNAESKKASRWYPKPKSDEGDVVWNAKEETWMVSQTGKLIHEPKKSVTKSGIKRSHEVAG